MWMMGCRDNSSLTMPDSCNTRRLRPLIPKPQLLSTSANTSSTSSSSCSSSSWVGLSNGEELFAFHNHSEGEQNRRELGAQVSSRWNPTPEQLRTLEDLYRRGTRTPTAEQIQYITAQLRRYGKIEGKNVFYWFQNHKARERQKRRRRTEAAAELDCCLEKKDSGRGVAGSSWIGFEQPKNWVPTNCSIRPEETILFSRAEKEREGANSLERLWKNNFHFNEDITARHQNNTNTKKTLDFIGPESSNPVAVTGEEPNNNEDHDCAETTTVETLQLFPLHSDTNTTTTTTTTKNSFTLPTTFNHSHHDLVQFFQFLPLKK